MTLKEHGIGIYQGYCEQHQSYTDYFETESVCHQFVRDSYMNFLTYGITTGLIVAIDQLLIIVNIAVITRIGFSTHEIVVRQICMSIFYSQFFNNGLLLLISNANLQYSPLSFISLESRYTEMDARWYQDVAPQIITSMFFKSFMPYV